MEGSLKAFLRHGLYGVVVPDEERETGEYIEEEKDKAYRVITLPKCALQQRGIYWRFRMPYTGERPGWDFYIPQSLVAEGRDAVTIFLPENYFVTAKRGETKTRIPAKDFADEMNEVKAADFEPPLAKAETLDAARADEEDEGGLVTLRMPGTESGKIYVPRRFVSFAGGKTRVRIPRGYRFRAVEDGKESAVTAEEYRSAQAIENAKNALKARQASGYVSVSVPAAARIYRGETRSYFKMPEGRYGECGFYLPNALVEETTGGKIELHIPSGENLKLTRDPSSPAVEISPLLFAREFEGKDSGSFSGGAVPGNPVLERAAALERLPEKMRKSPNWVVVRRARREDGSYVSRFINPVTGKEASSLDNTTWADFETALRFARDAGGHTLAYALDGGVCCLEAPEKRRKEVEKALGKTYSESAGEGRVRYFVKAPETDLSAFSKDGKETFFKKAAFVEMTGEGLSETREISDLRKSESARAYLEKIFQPRHLGKMKASDKEILEKAYAAKSGETMRALMNGKSVAGSRERSERMLMDRLAFWCSKEPERMMRIFSCSPLFDVSKGVEYYEGVCARSLDSVADVYKRPKSAREVLGSASRRVQSFKGEILGR